MRSGREVVGHADGSGGRRSAGGNGAGLDGNAIDRHIVGEGIAIHIRRLETQSGRTRALGIDRGGASHGRRLVGRDGQVIKNGGREILANPGARQ